MSIQNEVMVSICCLTYNHEKYVRQCLDGFVMQQTDFKFEIIIHDDASTDNTQEIIKEYTEKYPDLFVPKLQVENQFSKGIRKILATFCLPLTKGKYIALCEGDDYWTDPLKLQKQVDFLELNPDYGLIHSCAKVYDEKNKQFSHELMGSGFDDQDQLIIGNRIATLTACFRRDLCEAYYRNIEISPSWKMGDYPMWLYISSHSKVNFLNEVTGVYRVLENSASHSKDPRREVDFRLSACEISLFFAEKLNKPYLLPIIKQRALNLILFLYVKNNRSIDSHFWQIVKKMKTFPPKIIVAALMAEFEGGRHFLRKKYLQ